MRTFSALVLFAALSVATPVSAATISGVVSDSTGAALTMARVTLRSISTGQEVVVETDAGLTIQLTSVPTYSSGGLRVHHSACSSARPGSCARTSGPR